MYFWHFWSQFLRWSLWICYVVNSLGPRQNGHHFQMTFSNGYFWMEMYELWLRYQFVPGGPSNNIPALVQIMAWHLPGANPLSEPMIVHWCMYASLGFNAHQSQMTQLCISKQGHHNFRERLNACSAQSHYLNQWWLIILSTSTQ